MMRLPKFHPTLQTLPKSFRGLCQECRVIKCPINSPVKKARQGDFEPQTEVLSMRARKMVKQLRRLDSFFHRLKKLKTNGATTDKTMQELRQEWKAIRDSQAFGVPFLHWTQYV